MPGRQRSKTQLFVSRLAAQVTRESLQAAFEKYGPVVDIIMKPGYAFVTMKLVDDAYDAQKDMDGYKLEGKDLAVEFAKIKDSTDECVHCGKLGHPGNECYYKPQNSSRPGSSNCCFECGEAGHQARNCPWRGMRRRGRSESPTAKRRRSYPRAVSCEPPVGPSRSLSPRKPSRDSRSPIRSVPRPEPASRSPIRDTDRDRQARLRELEREALMARERERLKEVARTRERERQRERDRGTGGSQPERDRQRDRESDRDREREREREREKDRERERNLRERERERERERAREREARVRRVSPRPLRSDSPPGVADLLNYASR